MASLSLSRTTSQGSANSSSSHNASTTAAAAGKDAMPINLPHPPNSPTAPPTPRPIPPPRSRTSSSSHSLLSSNLAPPVTSRKSRFADAGTTPATTDRASISMPPPSGKPPTYKSSASRQPLSGSPMHLGLGKEENVHGAKGAIRALDQSAGPSDPDKMPDIQTLPASEPCSPLAPDSTLKLPPVPAASDPDGNRLSLSSLYSLGSAIYNGAVGAQSAPPSAASSNAGSVKSGTFDPTAAPLSPTRTSIRSDLSASVTTATDPVSVTANAHNQTQGPFFPFSRSRRSINWILSSSVGYAQGCSSQADFIGRRQVRAMGLRTST